MVPGIVENRYHNVAEESQDHHFIGWPPFPNSEGVPANSYRVGGNMTQLQVTSYGESGVFLSSILFFLLNVLKLTPSRS
jgi:hypothetical protein